MLRVAPGSVLVVGAGQAGLQLAASLRESGHRGPVTLVGAEGRSPYQRPPLSKDFLHGTFPEDGLALRTDGFYADHGIDVVGDDRVESITLGHPATGGGEAVTRSGRRLGFDRLALTTGGSPRRLSVPGSTLAGIHYLRSVQDSLALRHDLRTADEVVVVGGGFVGLEVAAGARAAGRNVTVVEAADRLLARAVAVETSAFYLAAHRARGTAVELGAQVTAFAGGPRVSGVVLADGRTLPADVVVIGIGMVADLALAEQIGATCAGGGIVVDADARTSIGGVVAAGDCTAIARPGGGYMRVESVQNAVAQGRIAAATLLGVDPPAVGVPWFWSDQHDIKLKIAGLNAGYDLTVVRGDPGSESFCVLYYRDGRLISIDAVNALRDYVAARRILDNGGTVPTWAAADPATPLSEFLKIPA